MAAIKPTVRECGTDAFSGYISVNENVKESAVSITMKSCPSTLGSKVYSGVYCHVGKSSDTCN
jgi:hypothetical protein